MEIKAVILILMINALWSCKLNKDRAVSEVNEEEAARLVKLPGKYITDFENEDCKLQIDSAKIDVEKGRLVYEDYKGGWSIIRYDDEMEEILKEYGIEYEVTGPNCMLEQDCYGYYMDSVIHQKFGKEFIKQIEKEADSLFSSKWETKTYDNWDIDEPPFYKGGDAEKYIRNKVRDPSNWDTIPIEFERQFLIVEASIDNNGNLRSWEFDDFYNLKESNEQFLPKIKEEINQIIKEMTYWEPGKLMGKKVNSRIWLDIDLDNER